MAKFKRIVRVVRVEETDPVKAARTARRYVAFDDHRRMCRTCSLQTDKKTLCWRGRDLWAKLTESESRYHEISR